ncbi:hypothetical protein APR04_001963 [Promicromonospora umidemergens]|uniref:Prenyltransferase/squalene oxidase-like repeat protein n=1 Tax=Promicromonospora umidemergens TaxID=629679 RepID=A0ABP8XC21_9MICO|nr:hypothetical protein [Promicromonospora umidemergens]MCP2283060.1 hypothetical protein [Promicromonospora umidemergens]
MSTTTSIDVGAAERFLYDDARLLERHRLGVLLHDAPASRVLDALRPYRNDDGGWGHALEPDLRGPDSQVSGALSALEVLAELGTAADPAVARLVTETADWLASVALPDGRVPHVLPTAADYPAAPWMQPNENGFLTFAITARLWELGLNHPWLDAATTWCWGQLEGEAPVDGYTVLFALNFLDAVPEPDRVAAAVERLRPALRDDGSIAVDGGQDDEQLTPLQLSARPGSPSRALFSSGQISAELDRLEGEQLEDGGWDFDFLHWSPGQTVEWRGIVTLGALRTLRQHERLPRLP